MELRCYPYRFVQRVDEFDTANTFLKHKLLYSFRSPKTHMWYWVWVEVYDHDFYTVKFHLKNHRHSPHKYNMMTHLYEARPVINTCIAIMQSIGELNPRSSFGFIGSNMENETEVNTKRFRVYRRFMATYFNEEHFVHMFNVKKSSYVMLRRSELEANPSMLNELDERFQQLYDYFD